MQELVKNTVDGALEKPKHTRKTPTHDQVAHATKLLGDHGKVMLGVYAFLDGWSDIRVRDVVGEPMTVDKVVSLRRKHHGDLPSELPVVDPEPDPGNVGKLKIEALQAEFAAIAVRIASLEKAVAAILTVIKLPQTAAPAQIQMEV